MSLSIVVSNSNPSRTDKIAVACVAMLSLTISLSPILILRMSILALGCNFPIPVVLMKILSPLPLSTTFVSPVTILTPAFSAAYLIETKMSQNSFIGSPSSIIKLNDKYCGIPPHIATSLTVPLIAKSPISPPGKKMGEMTKLSVEKATFPLNSKKAPS